MSSADLPNSGVDRTSEYHAVPLFYRRRTRANGETEEVSIGPSIVWIFRWIVVAIALALVMMSGSASPSALLRALLSLAP